MAGTQILDSAEEAATAALEVIANASRQLWIASTRLDPAIFGQPTLSVALSALALRHHRVEVQLLLVDPMQAARNAPGVISLARRLASRIQLRSYGPEQDPVPQEWLLADGGAVLQRDSAEQRQWVYAPHEPTRLREWQHRHSANWEHAVPCTELREMRI